MQRLALMLVIAIMVPLPAHAALNAYIRLKNAETTSAATVEKVETPKSAAPGQPAKKPTGRPYVFTLRLAPASPLIKELKSRAALPELTLNAGEQGAKDSIAIKLSDVVVSSAALSTDGPAGTTIVKLEAAQVDNLDPFLKAHGTSVINEPTGPDHVTKTK